MRLAPRHYWLAVGSKGDDDQVVEPVIHGERLLLRIWRMEDHAGLLRIVEESRQAFADWVPNALRDLADLDLFLEHVANAYRAGTGFFYAIEEDGEVIGQCSLHDHGDGRGEIGYWVRTDQTGRGVATRAVKALVAAACDAGFRELVIHCDAGNVPSASVARKSGFLHTGTVDLDRVHPRTQAQTGCEMTWILRRSGDV